MRRKLRMLPLFAVVILVVVLFLPPSPVKPVPQEAHAPDEGSPDIHPLGASIELNHGHLTDEVFVLLHGITNTPVQFRLFGKLLYESGANVVIPRMPFHGYRDRMTTASRSFTAQVMLDEANRAIDHAHTLGRRVTVIGLSVNGISAAWVAQNRSDVDTAVLMAPLFAARGMPNWAIRPASRLFSLLPNFFVWWDFAEKQNLGKGSLTYPRFSTRSMASMLQLGLIVFAEARTKPPLARRILILTSANDTAISNQRVNELTALWKSSAPGRVMAYEFPEEMAVPHDWMDPKQPDQQVEAVYPVLLELLAEAPSKCLD